jgi:hypothetical protein
MSVALVSERVEKLRRPALLAFTGDGAEFPCNAACRIATTSILRQLNLSGAF